MQRSSVGHRVLAVNRVDLFHHLIRERYLIAREMMRQLFSRRRTKDGRDRERTAAHL